MSFRPDGQGALADTLEEDSPDRELLRHPDPASALRKAFELPPFTILDTRQGEWQERKRGWLSLGIASELGRGGDGEARTFSRGEAKVGEGIQTVSLEEQMGHGALFTGVGKIEIIVPDYYEQKRAAEEEEGRTISKEEFQEKFLVISTERPDALTWDGPPAVPDYYAQKRRAEKTAGHELSREEFETEHLKIPASGLAASGTSVFDPVLCEMMYRWFCPPGGTVLDPFAGGSVRGVVAGILGRRYEGVDLSERQIEANRQQWLDINPRLSTAERDATIMPTWHVGDSRTRIAAIPGGKFDMIFTCPPYYDLEVYSDDPADLSKAGTYAEFLDGYQDVIFEATKRLADGRFAVFVVGDVRDKRGFYHGLTRDTIDALKSAGAAYYNHGVLINSVGSLPVRMARQFKTMRKLGKTHQDCVIAFKGDPKAIRESFPEET